MPQKILPSQRQEFILRRIEAEGSVKNIELACEFEVTNETIRKDLQVLAMEGRVIRIHGGATRITDTRHDMPLPARQSMNRFEKSIVARAAVQLIEPNDTLFLDASSTVLMMTDYLPQVPLTVLTNAHHVIVALGGRGDYDLICTGGTYEERSRSYVGAMAEDALKRFVIKWLFVGVDGLHHALGASEVNPGQAVLKERLIPRAENVCIVCDSTKLEQKSPFIFGEITQFSTLVTDDRADPGILKLYESAGIHVIVANLPKEI
jgi:DeoR/GlpR family transcriptional regulator of sugar metabolism